MKITKLFKKSHAYRMFLLVLCICFFGNVHAVTNSVATKDESSLDIKYFVIWEYDGGTVAFPIMEHPCVIPDVKKGEIKCVTTTQSVTFGITDVKMYSFEKNADPMAGIDQTVGEESSFDRNVNTLYFKNFKPGSPITIYNIGGVLVNSYKADASGNLSFSIESLSKGIYLIKTSSVTYKITKK